MTYQGDGGYLFPGNVTQRFPVLVRGEGSYVWDAQGKRYLDGIAGISVVNVGYGREEIAAAIAQQARTLPFCAPNLFRNEPAMRLSERLREFLPPSLGHTYFVSGGSEAVEVALKVARQYQVVRGRPGKHQVIARWTSYHGASLGALSATGHLLRRDKFRPMLLDFAHIPAAYCFRCPYGLQHPACSLRCAGALEEAILAAGPDSVSAFILEPIIGSTAGSVVPPDDYLPAIRAVCDQYDVLLIADEVLTGFGRTGRNFAVDHWGIVPDIMTLAKAISSGYAPLGATVVREEIATAFAAAGSDFDHVFTYAGSPISAVAGVVALDILQREGLVEQAKVRGDYLFSRAKSLRAHPIVGDIRGKGLMCSIEFVRDQRSMEPFPPESMVYQRVVDTAREKGLILYPGHGAIDGRRGDHFSLYPPLTISEAEIDEVVEMLDSTLAAVESTLGY